MGPQSHPQNRDRPALLLTQVSGTYSLRAGARLRCRAAERHFPHDTPEDVRLLKSDAMPVSSAVACPVEASVGGIALFAGVSGWSGPGGVDNKGVL